MKLDPSRRLPQLRSLAEAKALAEKEEDPFYLVAFRIQSWLGILLARTAAEYAEKKNPKDRYTIGSADLSPCTSAGRAARRPRGP